MESLDAPLGEEDLPPCWNDDTRMNALFAPCKHQSIAPEAWRQKMTFWSEVLRAWCRRRRSALVTVAAARRAFIRKKNRPACLDVVLDEYARNGEYVPASTYTSVLAGGGEGWVRWGARLALRPAALAVGALAAVLPLDRTPRDGMAVSSVAHDALYVNQLVIKELATELLRSFPEDVERVGTLEELMEAAGYSPAERQSFEVLLGYMITAGLALKKGELFKLAESSGARASPVSECDEALRRLLAAERRLAADADKYRGEEERALADTRGSLKDGNKTQAKAHLRRKHRCTERAACCESALDNVRTLLHQIRQSEVNRSIADTFKVSVGAMKQVLKDSNLDEDSAHETMDELREVLETYGDVEKSLAGGLEDYDAAELEDELEVLLAASPRDGGAGPGERAPEKGAAGGKRDKRMPEKEFVYDGEARMMAELNDLGVPERGDAAGRGGRRGEGKGERRGEGRGEKVAVAAGEWSPGGKESPKPPSKKPEKPKQSWYPPADQSLTDTKPEDVPWVLKKIGNLESKGPTYSLDALSNSTGELRTDPRLHPGQPLDPRFNSSTGPVLYSTDFQVQDHKLDDGVWFFNPKDDENRNDDSSYSQRGRLVSRTSETDFSNSTEYPELDGNRNQDSGGRQVTGGRQAAEGGFQVAPGGQRLRRGEPPSDGEFDDLERRLKNLRSFN